MRRIGIIYASGPKTVITVVLTEIDFLQRDENFGDLTTFQVIFYHILLQMRRKRYFSASSYNFDNTIGFSEPDFLHETEISAIDVHILFFFAFLSRNPPYFYFRSA